LSTNKNQIFPYFNRANWPTESGVLMESIILISVLLYLLSMAGYFAFLFIQKDYFQRAGFFLLLAGFLFHTLAIAYGFF